MNSSQKKALVSTKKYYNYLNNQLIITGEITCEHEVDVLTSSSTVTRKIPVFSMSGNKMLLWINPAI
jgi:hypothetical protein